MSTPASVCLTARWVLPIDRPAITPGWIEVREHKIVGVGSGPPPGPARDLGDVAVLPGLVNAHTHLELSWMEGEVPAADSFPEWVRVLMARRAAHEPYGQVRREQALKQAVRMLRQTGTVAVGDVSNTLSSVAALRTGGLGGCVFHELIGFDVPNPVSAVQEAWDRVDEVMAGSPEPGLPLAAMEAGPDEPSGPLPLSATVSAHAPYSVAPDLFAEIVRQHRTGPLTVHVGESAEEIEFLRHGRGPFTDLLQELGVWHNRWQAPGCGPVEYLDRLGYLVPGLLAVHGVHLNDTDLLQLREAAAVLVVCPRSNLWVGAGLPNVARAYSLGLQVALGTDSLASVPSLNLFDELAELRRIAPEVSAASLLESATRVGAAALGIERTVGTLAAGKRAALTAVAIPAGERDVEEYLVSGVPASAVRPLWL